MMNYIFGLMTSPWAIKRELLPLVSRVLGRLSRGEPMSDADRAMVAARQPVAAARRQETAQYASSGSGAVAVFPVLGILTQRGEFTDMSESTTSMSKLAIAIRSAARDPAVSAIVLDVDSPGGTVTGVMELADAIYDARASKPVAAVANSCAASAAFWLASQAGELYAAPGAEVGSIGVFATHADVSEALRQDGISMTLISAGKYKTELNAYAPLSSEARAAVQNTVDAHYDAFVRTVARGRRVPQKAVREGMGQGRMLLPDAARAERMIDGVATLGQVVAKMQARVAGRDRSAAGIRAYVAQQMSQGVAAPGSAPARALTREALQRELEVLKLT